MYDRFLPNLYPDRRFSFRDMVQIVSAADSSLEVGQSALNLTTVLNLTGNFG